MDTWYIKEIIGTIISVAVIAALWSIFEKLRSTEVSIIIHDDSIDLKTNKNEISVKPILHFSRDRKNKLLGIGDDFQSNEPSFKIDLFKYKGEVNGIKDYHILLSAFFRKAIYNLTGQSFFSRPFIKVKGAENIYAINNEVCANSFHKALKQAGAGRSILL